MAEEYKRLDEITVSTMMQDNDCFIMNLAGGGQIQVPFSKFPRVHTGEDGLATQAMFRLLDKTISTPNMKNRLTTGTNQLVIFKTQYVSGLTPTAGYAAGISFTTVDESLSEVQFLFDYSGRIYTRRHNGTEWSSPVLIAAPQ